MRLSLGLALGLDISTQSLTGVVLDGMHRRLDGMHHRVVCEIAIPYTDDRLRHHGIDEQHKMLPPRVEGEADQPPLLFLDALDMFFAKLQQSGVNMEHINVINVSAQQHGHVYLHSSAHHAFAYIAIKTQQAQDAPSLSSVFANSFSYDRAPIWMTSVSHIQADEIRDAVGGAERMIALSGSDSPARFTGAVIRRIGQAYADAYRHTARIHLLSSFITAVLAGNMDAPIDWGNGSGMSLMNYTSKKWSAQLLEAVSHGMPQDAMQVHPRARRDTAVVDYDGTDTALSDAAWTLYNKLPSVCSPLEIAGTLAPYFVSRYGCNPHCYVAVGSGDNPQSKVAVAGDVLSLGSSIVIMAGHASGHALGRASSSVGDKRDVMVSWANAMYDGVGAPFMFGCRTNGALVWDMVRLSGARPIAYDECETLLANTPIGAKVLLWQSFAESFPLSAMFDACVCTKAGDTVHAPIQAQEDYPAMIDSTLAIMHHYAKHFMDDTNAPLYVTGGPTQSQQVLKRVAAFWNRPVIPIGSAGAALGAAIAGCVALEKHKGVNVTHAHSAIARATIAHGEPVIAHEREHNQARMFEERLIQAYRTVIQQVSNRGNV